MYLLIICGQWACMKIYSELIASIICQFLFGYLPNVDISFNGHLQSATHYGTYLYPYICRGSLRCFTVFSLCCSQAWLRCQGWRAHGFCLRQKKKTWCIFHLNRDTRGCCHLSQWLLLNSFSRDEKANADISSAITGMLQVICSYVFIWAFKNKYLSLSLSVTLMLLSRTYSKHLLIVSSCIWHIIRLLKRSLCCVMDGAHV